MMKFAETKEGREYLEALQNGKATPGLDASPLEHNVIKLFHERRKTAGAIISERDRVIAQIAEGEEIAKTLTRKGDIATGEAKAYAEILLTAEGYRREENKLVKNPDAVGGENGDPDNEDRTSNIEPKLSVASSEDGRHKEALA